MYVCVYDVKSTALQTVSCCPVCNSLIHLEGLYGVAPWKARSETLLMLLNDRSTVVKLGDLGNALSRRTEIRFLEMSSCRPLGQGMEMILVHHM